MIYVKNLPQMREFYSELLRLKPVNDSWTESWADFDTGGARFALHAIPSPIAEQIEISSPPRPREKDPVKLVNAPAQCTLDLVRPTDAAPSIQRLNKSFQASEANAGMGSHFANKILMKCP